MVEYINRADVLDSKNIITVHTKEYGSIDVVPVDCIADIPAANVIEDRHGRWIISSDGYYPYCSECKEEPAKGIMSKHCPNCGAIMDAQNDLRPKIHVGENVCAYGMPGKVININEYREPDKKYAIYVGHSDLVFCGYTDIKKCDNCQGCRKKYIT